MSGSFPDRATLRSALALAGRAPSVHNSQPWQWRVDGDSLHLRGEVLRPDGSTAHSGHRSGPISDGAAMGSDLAQELLIRAGPGFFDWHVKG